MSHKILFINACVRNQSRTLQLADYLLDRLSGDVIRRDLEKEDLQPLCKDLLEKREKLLKDQDFSHELFRYAREFAAADEIVIAAPYWDLSFPALLKIYLETITISGITFRYEEEIPRGLCHAKRLIYVTTAGGPIFADFGYSYIKTLAETLYGIKDTTCIKAENLDVEGMDVSALLCRAKEEIATLFPAKDV